MEDAVKISDEQYKKIGIACGWAEEWAVQEGKRAVAAVAPILLAEETRCEIEAASEAVQRHGIGSGREIAAVAAIQAFRANRLASLTEKPDAAVEAVSRLMIRGAGKNPHWVTCATAAEIVAAVDAARGGK